MLKKRIIAYILNVKGTIIDNIAINDDCSKITISVHPTKSQQCRCPICGKKSPLYDLCRAKRKWRACDWNNKMVFLVSKTIRVKCKTHGILVARVPWARHDSAFTYDFEQVVAYRALHSSKSAVSKQMRIAWTTVGDIISKIKTALDTDPSRRFDNLVSIGIDETSYRKGHKYLTVVVNHDTSKVIWVSIGYGKKVLSEFFEQLTEEQRSSIKYISADGARWISSCIDKYCPGAKRCLDGFHLIDWANKELDCVRTESWRRAYNQITRIPKRKRGRPKKGSEQKDRTAEVIKNTRYALGKAPEHLTDAQKQKIDLIAKSDKRLYRAYLWKERLRLILKMSYVDAKEELEGWIKGVVHSRIAGFVKLGQKIKRHKEAILATIKYGLSNARIEATNNKIKLTIRMAYGFRNMENMLNMIMLRCSDIHIPLPWVSLIKQ